MDLSTNALVALIDAADFRLAWLDAEIARVDLDEDTAADHMNDRALLSSVRDALVAERERRRAR